MNPSRAFEVVVAASGAVVMLWSADGTMHVATDAASVGRWLLELERSPQTVRVPFARRSAWSKLAAGLVAQAERQWGGAAPQATTDHTAVQLVVAFHGQAVTVWPPKGGPQAVSWISDDATAPLGELVTRIALDESQPRCPAGPPADELEGLLERGVAALLREGR